MSSVEEYEDDAGEIAFAAPDGNLQVTSGDSSACYGEIKAESTRNDKGSLNSSYNNDNNYRQRVYGTDLLGNEATKVGENGQRQKPNKFFFIQEYNVRKDFTNGEQPLINTTIEELKSKLENKEILVRQRPNTPTSPLTPTTPTSPTKQYPSAEESDDMIPETRTPGLLTDDGLIAPRKPANPVREDPGRMNLHRELLFNQKIGKNVLNQKSELQRALERHKDNLAKKQLENHIAAKTPELEKVIADRARRLENPVKKEENEDDKVINKEFLQARMKLKSTNEIK